jgi:hypothetical protein
LSAFLQTSSLTKVIAVTVVSDDVCKNADNVEDESVGIAFLEDSTGWPLWKQTSYNTHGGKHYKDELKSELSADQSKALRANFAGVGMIYDEDNDIFKESTKPYTSWTMNTTTGVYEAPVAKPTEDQQAYEGSKPNRKQYSLVWDEDNARWLGSPVDTKATIADSTKVWNPGTSSWDNK